MTCKDCLGYEFCSRGRSGQTNFYGKESACNNVEYLCPDFKDKSRFVEIVRCRDCEKCVKKDNFMYCEEHSDGWGDYTVYVDPDDYCSYGERQTE